MGQTLNNGLYLPDEGERYCYDGLASNWTILDAVVGGYNAHIGNTTIHITSEERIKWNTGVTQAYVLRYASSSVSANSTVAYSSLDNTDNVKIDDKVLDQDGKLYSVTAVDSANSQITVGALLIDLSRDSDLSNYYTKAEVDALDSNAVHKTGNETITGTKTFSAAFYIYNDDSTSNTPNLYFKSSKAKKGDTSGSNSDSSRISHIDKDNKLLSYIQLRKVSNGSSDITFYCSTTDTNNQDISSSMTFFKSVNGQGTFRSVVDNDVNLGDASYKWKNVNTYLINDLTPSSISLPSSRSSRVDISGYFLNLGSGDVNSYTVPSNGYIYLDLQDVVVTHCLSQTSLGVTNYGQTFSKPSAGQMFCLLPVRNGDLFKTQWFTTAANVTVNNAYFIPCQGNI